MLNAARLAARLAAPAAVAAWAGCCAVQLEPASTDPSVPLVTRTAPPVLNVVDFVSPHPRVADALPAFSERGDMVFCSAGANISLAASIGEPLQHDLVIAASPGLVFARMGP
jgi:hypothetical protein